MRVLLVEDEPRLAKNLAQALHEGAQYAVDIARDGDEAQLLGESRSYDGIVLDLMLPERCGGAQGAAGASGAHAGAGADGGERDGAGD